MVLAKTTASFPSNWIVERADQSGSQVSPRHAATSGAELNFGSSVRPSRETMGIGIRRGRSRRDNHRGAPSGSLARFQTGYAIVILRV